MLSPIFVCAGAGPLALRTASTSGEFTFIDPTADVHAGSWAAGVALQSRSAVKGKDESPPAFY